MATPGTSTTTAFPWPTWAKVVVSCLLLLHIIVQCLATFDAAPPPSQLVQTLKTPAKPYIHFAKLDNGYRFFAPDPGPSHLLDFQVLDGNNQPIPLTEFQHPTKENWGRLPPPELRVPAWSPRPRQLYHRYFMLMEQLQQFDPLPEYQQGFLEDARHKEQLYLGILDSYAKELLRRTGGKTVKLIYLEHKFPPTMEIYLQQPQLDHPDSYVPHPMGELTFPRTTNSIMPIGPQVRP
jgi:hypothetical protein